MNGLNEPAHDLDLSRECVRESFPYSLTEDEESGSRSTLAFDVLEYVSCLVHAKTAMRIVD
ncbi:MAG: hypothetical protein AMXMBFR84_09100 [Candidatus Hydrogenedentota bacterium]